MSEELRQGLEYGIVVWPFDRAALPNPHKSLHAGLGLELSCSAFNFLAAGGMSLHPPAGGPRHLPDA